ncbi:hypothetical protein MTO96_007770 [Rhipicephalus appendiculatus]
MKDADVPLRGFHWRPGSTRETTGILLWNEVFLEIETRPFQKLLFLVRDWTWPHEREFGYRGGRSLIASRLEVKDGQDKELKTLRQSISSCFSDIDCFLMPHPGEKVALDKSFDGRLADIKEVFRENLLQLVPSILAPRNLLVKEINGRKLSCQDLMIFFKTYVDVFKRGDLPEPTSMLLATANATNVAAMEKARKCYMSGMTNRPRRNLDRLSEFHRELLAEAKKVFNDFPKMGGDAISTTSMDALVKARTAILLYRHLPESTWSTATKKQSAQQREAAEREAKLKQDLKEKDKKIEELKKSEDIAAGLKAVAECTTAGLNLGSNILAGFRGFPAAGQWIVVGARCVADGARCVPDGAQCVPDGAP